MPIEFRCQQCGRLLRTPDESVGHQARCPACGCVQPVPAAAPPGENAIEPEIVAAGEGSFHPVPGYAPRSPYEIYQQTQQYALERLALPATALMVCGVVSALASTCALSVAGGGAGWRLLHGDIDWAPALGLTQMLLGLAASLFIVLGASKMKRLENYGQALLAAILALLPVHCCCFALVPLGIWTILILNDPYVKAAFRS